MAAISPRRIQGQCIFLQVGESSFNRAFPTLRCYRRCGTRIAEFSSGHLPALDKEVDLNELERFVEACTMQRRCAVGSRWRRQFNLMVCNARRRSARRGHSVSISADDLIEMLWAQRGRCYYSGVPVEFSRPHSHWRMSCERLNNSEGYSKQNCVLIANEFNTGDTSKRAVSPVFGSAQWSRCKVWQVPSLRSSNIDLDGLTAAIQEARPKNRRGGGRGGRRTPRRPNATGMWECSACGSYKAPDMFYTWPSSRSLSLISSRCKYCHRDYCLAYSRTLRGTAVRMAADARTRDRLRHQASNITADDILDMLQAQQGRCYYSGVPLEYSRTHSDWRVSLERLDNGVRYVLGNVALVAHEFNTSDHSRNVPVVNEVRGTAQWSKTKVEYVWGS